MCLTIYNRVIQYYLVKNLSEKFGTQLSAFDGTGELLEMRLLILAIVGGRTGKNGHFDAFLTIRSAAKHDLSGEPGAQFAGNGKIKPRQSFE